MRSFRSFAARVKEHLALSVPDGGALMNKIARDSLTINWNLLPDLLVEFTCYCLKIDIATER